MPKSADLDSETKQPDGSGRRERDIGDFATEDVPWTLLDREELQTAYHEHVAPALRADGFDAETHKPTHEWLSANGFRGLVYALREYHGRSFGEFWRDDLDLADDPDGYQWGIDHDETIDAFERFLTKRQSRLDWEESTVAAHRYRLNRYAVAYHQDDLLSPVAPEGSTDETAAADATRDAFDALDAVLSRRTLERVHRTVRDWYDWLEGRRMATHNPAAGIRFNWSADDSEDTPALSPAQVRDLYSAAVRTRDRLLVVALCAWGLRTAEVARLHSDQLALDDANPHIAFDERKNGPGTVAVIYGADVAEARLARVGDGYLFPSERSDSGHVSATTIWRWFGDLVDRAGIESVGGRDPQPKMGRRFWYDRYSAATTAVTEQLADVAAEQGSTDPAVVAKNYLSDDRLREMRREEMRERLAEAFENRES